MNTAYIVDRRYGRAEITQFSYEKESPECYMGATETRRVTGGLVYVGKRVRKDVCRTTLKEAFELAIGLLKAQMLEKQREVNSLSTEIGQLESKLRKLTEAA